MTAFVLAPALLLTGCWHTTFWSPDSRRIAVADGRLYLFDIETHTFRKPVEYKKNRSAFSAAWSADGRRLCYFLGPMGEGERGPHSLMTVDPESGRSTVLVPRLPLPESEDSCWWSAAAWRPDGTEIAYHGIEGAQGRIWLVPSTGGRPRRLPTTAPSAFWPAWSPDGRWLAYCASEPQRPLKCTILEIIRSDGASRRLLWQPPQGLQLPGRYSSKAGILRNGPQWSSDGKAIGLVLKKRTDSDDKLCQVWVVRFAEGTARLLAEIPTEAGWVTLSADLRLILYWRNLGDNNWTIELLAPPYRTPRVLARMPESEAHDLGIPSLSPDGKTAAVLQSMNRRAARLRLYPTDGRPPSSYPVP